MRKPGEPIYLRIHLIALALVIAATVALPHVAEVFVGPLSSGPAPWRGWVLPLPVGLPCIFFTIHLPATSPDRVPIRQRRAGETLPGHGPTHRRGALYHRAVRRATPLPDGLFVLLRICYSFVVNASSSMLWSIEYRVRH